MISERLRACGNRRSPSAGKEEVMWSFRDKTPTSTTCPDTAGANPSMIELRRDDTMHDRVEKAMRYAGFVNPNRLGKVDSIAFVLGEYDRLFGPAPR